MHPYLFTDFRRNVLSFSPFNKVLDIGLLHVAFFLLQYITCVPSFFQGFIMKDCGNLLKVFCVSIEMIM